MKIKILHKVFLALVVSTGIALAVMALLVQWSLGRGFLAYVNAVEQTRLSTIAVRLAGEYELRDNSWAWVTQNQGRDWKRLTRNGRPRPPREVGRDIAEQPETHREPSSAESPKLKRDAQRRDSPRPPPPRNVMDMGPRLSLFDADKTHVIGRTESLESAAYRVAIDVEDNTVGWLTLTPLRRVSAMQDVSFLQQQSRAFITIAVGLLIGATLLAIYFARHLTRPLKSVTGVVGRLAEGNYSDRIGEYGTDEIGELSRDIDTLARTLDENQQARQRWIADISHELRTPLAIMQGELEALKDGVRQVDNRTLDSLHVEVMQLAKLVNDLHELSLSDLGALSYQMLPVDLGDVLEEAVELFRQRFVNYGLTLHYPRQRDSSWPVVGDRQRLSQLFANVLENSLRYTDTGGRVEITVAKHAEHAVVVIKDTAPTVSAEDCEKLFDRLYRVDESRNRAKGGSGLGLAICKNIADAHDAHISASPSDIGGMAITFKIPLKD